MPFALVPKIAVELFVLLLVALKTVYDVSLERSFHIRVIWLVPETVADIIVGADGADILGV